jgi:hypothetical protein
MWNDIELWEPLPGYEGLYAVGSLGHVRSVPRRIVHRDGTIRRWLGGPLRAGLVAGYLGVRLSRGGRETSHHVHALVALAFLGPRPDGMQVHHKNGLKLDNRLANLMYVSASRNTQHAYDEGFAARGERHYRSRLTEDAVREIRAARGRVSKRELARMYGVHPSTIGGVWTKRNWKHVD